jgi:hypothetical protein
MPLRVLLDECLSRKLKQYFTVDHVSTVQENGWLRVLTPQEFLRKIR